MGEDDIRDAGQDAGVTVAEAAQHLGITKEAVRKRISRDTLRSDKGPDGTVRVYIPVSSTAGDADESKSASDALISEMRDRIASLERQLEQANERDSENRRVIAMLTSRIPAIEAAESEDSPTPTDTSTGTPEEAQAGTSRRWWEFWR